MSTENIAARLARLLTHVPDMTLEELDALAGLSRGHSSQIHRGAKADPRRETVEAIASVFGARAAWLTYAEGREPGARAVQAAVKEARAGVHRRRNVRRSSSAAS